MNTYEKLNQTLERLIPHSCFKTPRCCFQKLGFPLRENSSSCLIYYLKVRNLASKVSKSCESLSLWDVNVSLVLVSVTGRYGRLTITFEFKRRINFYLLRWYLPATLIVVLSRVGFWIDTKSTPARISLGTITILAMGGFLIGEQEGFPSVSYIRAIDIYLITCFVFVFGCMVEYAIVHYAQRVAEERKLRKKNDEEVQMELTALTLITFDR